MFIALRRNVARNRLLLHFINIPWMNGLVFFASICPCVRSGFYFCTKIKVRHCRILTWVSFVDLDELNMQQKNMRKKRKKKGIMPSWSFQISFLSTYLLFFLFALVAWCGNSCFVLRCVASARQWSSSRNTPSSCPRDIRNGWHLWCPLRETRRGWIVSARPQNRPGLEFPRRSFHPYPARNVYSVKRKKRKKYSFTQCESILGAHAINPHAQLTLHLLVSSPVEAAWEPILGVL